MKEQRAKSGKSQCWTNEHELRAMDQNRFTTDGIHFDKILGQGWMNRVFQEQLVEEATNVPEISTLVHLETPWDQSQECHRCRRAPASKGRGQTY